MKYKSNESNIWLTSDSHYGHKNIVRGVSEWDKGYRDFDTIEEMNRTLVDGINKYVQQDDILIHLGDWSMGGKDNIWKFRQRLNVKKIFLVAGNHDTHILKDMDFPFPNVNTTMFSHIPQFEDESGIAKISVGPDCMFTNVYKYLDLVIDKKNIVLSHYPITSWDRAYRGSWMLHGHTHGTLFRNESPKHWYHNSKIMDVGMDTAFELFGEYRPFSFLDIKSIMDKRDFISIDQHDEKTNG